MAQVYAPMLLSQRNVGKGYHVVVIDPTTGRKIVGTSFDGLMAEYNEAIADAYERGLDEANYLRRGLD